MKYTELPENEQPRRRMQDLGPRSLSTPELLSVAMWISDTDQAAELSRLYNEYGSLIRVPREKIVAIKGLGERYADALFAIWEIGRRESTKIPEDRLAVHSPTDIAELVRYEMGALEFEQLRVVLLNTRNQVKRIVTLYQGSVNSSQVRVNEIFRDAIKEVAPSIIVVHNHPSGDPSPSPDDIALTRAIVQAGKLLDIDVLDHLIIGHNRYVSLKERGLGFG
jgi:DNA repair protein RadC